MKTYNTTVNLRRKNRSLVRLPPSPARSEGGAKPVSTILPGAPKRRGEPVHVQPNLAPNLEPPRVLQPSESNFDRLWRQIESVSVGWVDREETSYMLFFFTLSEHVESRLQEELCVSISFGKTVITLPCDPRFTFVEKRTLFVRTDFSDRTARRLLANRERTDVLLIRASKPLGASRKYGTCRSFTATRAGALRPFA